MVAFRTYVKVVTKLLGIKRRSAVGALCPYTCGNVFFGSFAVTPTNFREHFIEPTHGAINFFLLNPLILIESERSA